MIELFAIIFLWKLVSHYLYDAPTFLRKKTINMFFSTNVADIVTITCEMAIILSYLVDYFSLLEAQQ